MTNAPTTPSADLRRQQWSADWAVVGIFLFMALGVLTVAQSFFIPLAFATILSLVLAPVRRVLEKAGLPSGGAAALIVAAFLSAIVSLLFFAGQSLQQRFSEASDLIPTAIERFEELAGYVEPVVEATEDIGELTSPDDAAMEVVVREGGLTPLIAEVTPVLLGQILFTLALLFFLLASGDMFYEKTVGALPKLKDKTKALEAICTIERQLSSYLLTITLINAGLGVAVGLAVWGLGLPDPLLFGLAAFALNYIPYVGAAVGVGVTFLVGLLTFDSAVAAALPALAYWLLTSLEGQVLTPALVGHRLKLNAVAVFLAVAFWAWLWGLVGMFLSTPMLILTKIIADNTTALQSFGAFLGEREAPKASDRRLIRKLFKQTS